jgi:hypothetical protein
MAVNKEYFMSNKDIVTKGVRDAGIIAGHTVLQKVAGKGALVVAKNTTKDIVKWIPKKAIAKVGPVAYVVVKAVDAGIYVHDNWDGIQKDGLLKTVGQDLKKGLKEHPVKTVVKIAL